MRRSPPTRLRGYPRGTPGSLMVGVSYGRPVSDSPTDDAPRSSSKGRRLAIGLAVLLAVFALLSVIPLVFPVDPEGGVIVDPSVECQEPDGTTYWQFGTSCQYPDVRIGP